MDIHVGRNAGHKSGWSRKGGKGKNGKGQQGNDNANGNVVYLSNFVAMIDVLPAGDALWVRFLSLLPYLLPLLAGAVLRLLTLNIDHMIFKDSEVVEHDCLEN